MWRIEWTKDYRASGVMPWRQRKPELTELGKEMDQWDLAQKIDSTTGSSASFPKGSLAPGAGWVGFIQLVSKLC